MSVFCPTCGNGLAVVERDGFIFQCRTCPYVHSIKKTIVKPFRIQKKVVDDVLGGEDAWKNVDQTTVECPYCSNMKAYFMQIQTRSADEPMTTFYKCTSNECGKRWKD